MIYEFNVRTNEHSQILDITHKIRAIVKESGVRNGLAFVFIPHTTAAVTINENADPDVKTDFLMEFEKIVPWEDGYRHMEGNAAAHLKATMTGFSETIIIEENELLMGTWQGVWFTEYDGPRTRRVIVKILESK